MTWRWLLPLIPFGLSLAIATLLGSGRLDNPILYLRADLGTLTMLVGLALSTLAASLLLLRNWATRARRQAQTQVADDRRRFVQRLDHELKNPLTAIRAGLANLADTAHSQTQQTALESVETQTLRLSRLLADLRKLAELETRPLERTPLDLADLLEEVLALAREQHQLDDRRLTLTLPQAPWPLPIISADWDLLFLAIHNLLDNALKFTRPGDTVEVRAFEDGAVVVLEVADTGPGIPEPEITHIWEELYRGQGARGIPGSGLGLALVRAIAERHGGQVVLRSRLGQGTVITMRLPMR